MEEACQGTGHGRGFVEYWEDGFDRNQFTDTKISTALCLWHISQEMLSHFATQTGNYYQQNYLTQKDLIPFQTAIGGVLNNINDGQMFILSNNGQYRLLQNNNEEFKAVKDHFPGTLINLVLDTKY